MIGDGGDFVATAANVIPLAWPQLWMDPGPLGTLGIGPGFAMAARLPATEFARRHRLRRRFFRPPRARVRSPDPSKLPVVERDRQRRRVDADQARSGSVLRRAARRRDRTRVRASRARGRGARREGILGRPDLGARPCPRRSLRKRRRVLRHVEARGERLPQNAISVSKIGEEPSTRRRRRRFLGIGFCSFSR